MARRTYQLPLDARLDADLDASLRRQFVVPAVGVLPSALTGLAADGGAATGGFNIDYRINVSLRQAAGLLLAASLWVGAGYLFFDHLSPPARSASTSIGARYGFNVDAESPLGTLISEFGAVTANRGLHLEKAAEQNQLWDRLESELAERRGDGVIPHLKQLRAADHNIELIRVDEEQLSGDNMLMVSARVNGIYAAAVIEPSKARFASQDVDGLVPGVVEPPDPNFQIPHLFLSRYPGGFAYETALDGEPVLIPALLPDAALESSIMLGRSSNRRVHAVVMSLSPS